MVIVSAAQIFEKITSYSEEDLEEVSHVLEAIEERRARLAKVMASAGVWADIDNDIFRKLTTGLPEDRLEQDKRDA